MKHKWKSQWLGWLGDLRCVICGKTAFASCDPLDADKTIKFVEKTYARSDCEGQK